MDQCDTCGHIRISYNSCRNRHCPKCQNTQREAWIEKRKADLLPVSYFHVVFTVPQQLNTMFLQHNKTMYDLLFAAAWQTIAQFSYTQMLAETGMVAVLHTWGQNLSLHPHLHCIVPGGGIDYKGNWKQVKVSEKGKAFLFHVKSLSRVFRAKLMEALQKKIPVEKSLVHQLYKTPWVIYARQPFAGAQQVVEYLGRYTHKVAISNHRIIHIDENGVTFNYRDYRDNHKKQMTLGGVEFLRRFSQHILPKGFVRIRHYGLLSTARRNQLRELQNQLGGLRPDKTPKKDWKQICREYLDYDPDQCPCCHKGKMITVEVFLPGRAPPALS